jgi:LacI family transcriptional regulator
LLLIAPLDPSAYLNTLRDQNYPYVLIDQADPANKSNVVDATNRQGAYDATRYLCELGHTRIACITGLLEMNSAAERLEGYKAALSDCKLPYREELVIQGDFWQKRAYEGTKSLLKSRHRPTAIFASNDLSALGAMEAAREANIRIPDDLSIVGFDDIPQSSIVFPKLTTVQQPLQEMGRVATKLLLDQIENPTQLPRRITLVTQLIIRDSCAPYLT